MSLGLSDCNDLVNSRCRGERKNVMVTVTAGRTAADSGWHSAVVSRLNEWSWAAIRLPVFPACAPDRSGRSEPGGQSYPAVRSHARRSRTSLPEATARWGGTRCSCGPPEWRARPASRSAHRTAPGRFTRRDSVPASYAESIAFAPRCGTCCLRFLVHGSNVARSQHAVGTSLVTVAFHPGEIFTRYAGGDAAPT